MKIVRIFANLYSIHYNDQELNEFRRLFAEWANVLSLYEFFEANSKDFKPGYHGSDIDSAILDLQRKSIAFQHSIRRFCFDNNNLDEYFKPLSENNTAEELFATSKAYGTGNPSLLRLYALRIDEGVYVITGGAIKLVKKMRDADNLKKELMKLNMCLDYFRSKGIDDIEGFKELL